MAQLAKEKRLLVNVSSMRALLFSLAFLLTATTQASAGSIEDRIDGIATAFNSEDWAYFEEAHTPDAIALPPNQNRAEGRSAVVKLWKDYHVSGISDLTFSSLEVNAKGEQADQHGTYSMNAPDQDVTVAVRGSFLAIWEQDAATSIWRIRRFSWNVEP